MLENRGKGTGEKACTVRIHCRSPQAGEHPIPSGKTLENLSGKHPRKIAGTEYMNWLRLAGEKRGEEACRS